MIRPQLCLLAALTVIPSDGQAQSKWCEYQERSLAELIATQFEGMEQADYVQTADQMPSRARLLYSGEHRLPALLRVVSTCPEHEHQD